MSEWFENYYTEDANGCWIYSGRIRDDDYGNIFHNGKHEKAHRLFWELHNSKIPEGMKVLHKCDVRSCVNPAHLFLGTQQDNMTDMKAKGRWPDRKGSINGNAKLSEGQILEIFTLLEEGRLFNYEIAELYGVAGTTISYIKNKGWRHLKEKDQNEPS